jgi:tryptophanyl-tRNA synthetase
LEKCNVSGTVTNRLKDELKEFMALVPTEKVLEIALDYLANDPDVKEFVVYIQSEEFPEIHTIVEQLKEYINVSAFMHMFLKHQSDRKYMFNFNWCLYFSFPVCEVHQ